jgi:hypothetical protein
MQWLTAEDATRYGIDVELIRETVAQPAAPATSTQWLVKDGVDLFGFDLWDKPIAVTSAADSSMVSQAGSRYFVPKPCVPCFLRGTRILTDCGEVAVENLRIGNLVITESGPMPVKWIGDRAVKNSGGLTWPSSVMPIRISRFAFDEHTPHRDLYLSPGHALFIDGALVSASCFDNGVSILPALPEGVDTIQYFQVELATHQVIYAEGTPVETFLANNATREIFSNFAEYGHLYPGDTNISFQPYARQLSHCGGRAELKGLLRRVTSQFVDIRDPIQIAYDRLAKRGREFV